MRQSVRMTQRSAERSWSSHPRAAGVMSSCLVLGACLVLAGFKWHGWHMGLFLWGLALAAAGALYAVGNQRLAISMLPDASEAARARLRSRQHVLEIEFIIMGVGIAVAAAGTGWIAVDAGFTGLLVIVGSISTFAGVVVVKRSRQQPPTESSQSPTDNNTE
jgi:hypothetical protein